MSVSGGSGAGGRSAFLKIDHFVQVGNLPDGTPILELVYVDFFDDNDNNTQDGALDPPIGEEGNAIHALGGDDVIVTFGGVDTIHGGTGNDTVRAGAGSDYLHGEAGQEIRGHCSWARAKPHGPMQYGRSPTPYGPPDRDTCWTDCS